MPLEIRHGNIYPLGATVRPDGIVNFAVFSENASAVDLCLFDEDGVESRVRLTRGEGYVWCAGVKGLSSGQRYGFRASGKWAPKEGYFFNPAKLLIDPYARQLDSPTPYHPTMAAQVKGKIDRRNSAPHLSKSVVYDTADYDWEGDTRVNRPLRDSVLYEMHVKGFSYLNPDVPTELRGTYAGLAHESSTRYLNELGVTAVQLLPIHQHLDDSFLLERGLKNYWGYNTIGFFAPEAAYSATQDPVREFRDMVKALHRAGIEVILDVVYNHTGETGPDGPTVFLRGLENLHYYRTVPGDPQYYFDVTGCGNTVAVPNRRAFQLTLDSLRYWVEEMHVDGFRFDLAVTMGRDPAMFNRDAAFFKSIAQDPVLSQVKMIAEPWDLGRGGYQVGGFPPGWRELNGKFRDCARRFWVGHSVLGEFATRLTGSQDCFGHSGRTPLASFNFITSHDGFTINDLTAYNEKHNLANGESNNDGDGHNVSWNHGVEGITADPKIIAARHRQRRNYLVTMFLSQGVPFILGGDERGRTQGGNNNAYCQDSEISWFSWELADHEVELLEFTKKLTAFRRAHPILRKRRFFTGNVVDPDTGARDVMWFCPDGSVMEGKDWDNHQGEFQMIIHRDATPQNSISETLLVVFNATPLDQEFELPGDRTMNWHSVMDTTLPTGFYSEDQSICANAGVPISVTGKSVQIWELDNDDFIPPPEKPKPVETKVDPEKKAVKEMSPSEDA